MTTTTTLYRGTDTIEITHGSYYSRIVDRGEEAELMLNEHVADFIDGHLDAGWIRALTVATLEGGDSDNDYTGKAIWLDLGGEYAWFALVADQAAAEELAHNTGAKLTGLEEWDCGAFGDETVFAIESEEPGVITRDGGGPVETGFRCDLPDGWMWGEVE